MLLNVAAPVTPRVLPNDPAFVTLSWPPTFAVPAIVAVELTLIKPVTFVLLRAVTPDTLRVAVLTAPAIVA